jgi:FkbM family methyltransferase
LLSYASTSAAFNGASLSRISERKCNVSTAMIFKKSPIRFAKQVLINHHEAIRWLIPDHYFAFPGIGGRIYLNIKESSMMLARAFGLYELRKVKAVQSLLRSGDTFIDVGGNKGDFALLAAKITGDSGQVVCVEPEPTNCKWIRQSIQLNQYQNIDLWNVALSDHDSEALLYLGTKSGFHTLLSGQPERNQGCLKVTTRTLDALLKERKTSSVQMIKIDVEGAELQVLRGSVEVIKNNPDIVLLLDIHPFLGVDPVEVFDFLRSLGLTVCQMRPPYNVPATPHQGIDDVVARRL